MPRLPAALRHPALHVLLVLLVAVAGLAAGVRLRGTPRAAFHDEYCYLLAADTFARGRLSNPTHPHWEHFESLHLIHEPTYSSKYPPGQGLVLAAGQALTGSPDAGVWFGIVALCGAVCWMLQGWMPRRWALVGGVLTAVQFAPFGYWSHSYWGGALAATGGALVFGAAARLRRRDVPWTAVALGVGLGLLALTRPFEGLLASLPVAVWLWARWFRRLREGDTRWVLRAVAPTVLVLVVFAGWTAVHDRAVTGSAVQMPYAVHEQRYAVANNFLWVDPVDRPRHPNPRIAGFHHGFGYEIYTAQRTLRGWFDNKPGMAWRAWSFLLGPVLGLAIVGLLFRMRRRRWRKVLVPLLLVALPALGLIAYYAHYIAPITGLVLLLAVEGLRGLAGRLGERSRASLVLVLLVLAAVGVERMVRRDHLLQFARWHTCYAEKPRLRQQLTERGGHHVVFVRYAPDFTIHDEWVYNGAEIDEQTVVWAHDLGPERNAALVAYYADREAWLLELGVSEPSSVELGPYPR